MKLTSFLFLIALIVIAATAAVEDKPNPESLVSKSLKFEKCCKKHGGNVCLIKGKQKCCEKCIVGFVSNICFHEIWGC